MINTNILEDIGLSKSEIKTYITLLELGRETLGKIISKSGLQSSVVHRALITLAEKGLVTYIKQGKDRHYTPEDPENLLNYIENKKKNLKDILPELKEKQLLSKDKNETKMFIGKKAIFTMLNNLIESATPKSDYLSFTLVEPHIEEDVIRFYNQFNLRRYEKKLNVKVLGNKKVKNIFEEHYSKKLLKKANVRYTSFNLPQGLIILQNNVIFLNWQEDPFAVKITNSLMAKQYSEFFLDLYEKAKPAY